MNLKHDRNIMYIMVVGFHHKKGCQLEYVYPCDSFMRKKTDSSVNPDSTDLYELPKQWKHVPSLALPDGSHNYDQDFIYFHLEDASQQENKTKKDRSNKTIFGVSCYRQIDASEMIKKDSDVTRNTLQKSVCILSRQPIYSSLRLKLHSITTAYFAQKDFHKTQILQNAFHSLSASYVENLDITKTPDCVNEKSKYLMGLSLADLVLKYQHKILVLFKLLLLQKKCLFQIKPVSNLSNTIMALVSLIPDLFSPEGLENCSGFFDSIDLVNSELNRKSTPSTSPVTTLPPLDKLNRKMHKKFLKKQAKSHKNLSNSNSSPIINSHDDLNESKGSILNTLSSNTQKLFSFNAKNKIDPEILDSDSDIYKLTLDDENKLDTKQSKLDLKQSASQNSLSENENLGDMFKNKVNNVINWSTTPNRKSTLVRSESINSKNGDKQSDLQLTDLLEIDFGMPMNLFNEFNILHPYLSLYYLDYFMTINKMSTKLFCTTALMMNMMKENRQSRPSVDDDEHTIETKDNSVKKSEPKSVGYTIGATNVLFKQRLYDDLDVFVDDCEIDLKNNETLKKILQLTTADLRFSDYLIKNVNAAKSIGEKLNQPTLLSIKKTSSFSNFDPKDVNDTSGQASTWEGSDDWIRLNFKWYFYSLLGCILKEEDCSSIKNDLESILVNINNDISSSSSSLDNEVVDIEEYIEKVNTSQVTLNQESKGKKDRKNSSSSASTISSSQYFYIIQNSNQFSNYREDFNTNFVNEFKKTDCFKQWLSSNKTKLEKSLLKFDLDRMNQQFDEAQSSSQKFQILFHYLHDLEQVRLSHPFNGQISVNDIKLRFNFLFTTTESGRKINKAFAEGSKLVNNTGKVVGDALSQAKSSFSSFLSNWNTSSNSASTSTKTTSKNFTKI